MSTILSILQIITAALLVGSIMLQVQGSGLGQAFGGGGASYHTKRGMEKAMFTVTIILASLFMGLSLVNVITR